MQMPLRREITSLIINTLARYPTDEEISVTSIKFCLIIIMVTFFSTIRLQLAEL